MTTTFRKLRALCRVLKGNRCWHHHNDGCLRTKVDVEDVKGQRFCPLTYAYYVQTGRIIPVSEFTYAAESLGLTIKEAEQIADAADDPYGLIPKLRKLRRILEKACGVKS